MTTIFNFIKKKYYVKNKYVTSQQIIKQRYDSLKVPYNGLDNDDYAGGTSFCNSCRAGSSQKLSANSQRLGNNENAELLQYYYHPDHLGSSSFITDLDGNVAQHVEYVPFGEVFLEEHNNTWQTPYLFNGKELDEETGLYYYGARYYDPKVSLFISHDPLAEKTGTPYQYCYQNPINLTDPTGMEGEGWIKQKGENGESIYTYNALINTKEQAEKAGYENVVDVSNGWEISNSTYGYKYNLNNGGTGTLTENGSTVDLVLEGGSIITAGGSTINLSDRRLASGKIEWVGGPGDPLGIIDVGTRILAEKYPTTTRVGAVLLPLIIIASKGKGISSLSTVERAAVNTEMTTVGRWMSQVEYDAMKTGGRMLEGAGGKTSISTGGFNSFTGAAKGSVYAEFQVPTNSLIQGGQPNWFSILGPNASKSQLFMLQKQGGQVLPQIQNLSPILKIK